MASSASLLLCGLSKRPNRAKSIWSIELLLLLLLLLLLMTLVVLVLVFVFAPVDDDEEEEEEEEEEMEDNVPTDEDGCRGSCICTDV